jgi:hypothetical protein
MRREAASVSTDPDRPGQLSASTRNIETDSFQTGAGRSFSQTMKSRGGRSPHQPPEVQERVVVMVGDMRVFTLAERFALIIAPSRAFLHNLTEHDQLACLDRVREHLGPSGCFAFQRVPSVAGVHGPSHRRVGGNLAVCWHVPAVIEVRLG